MSRRWPGNFTPSSRRSYGENIASMAWGARNLIYTQEFVVISGTLNFLALYNALITARILLSWFPQAQGQPLLQPLFVVTDPFLNLFRGLGLNFGGLDFSILPAFFLLNALTNAVPALGADASFLVDPSALM